MSNSVSKVALPIERFLHKNFTESILLDLHFLVYLSRVAIDSSSNDKTWSNSMESQRIHGHHLDGISLAWKWGTRDDQSINVEAKLTYMPHHHTLKDFENVNELQTKLSFLLKYHHILHG